MVVLALNEGGALAHVLLLRRALAGKEERLRLTLWAPPVFSVSFISPQEAGGHQKNRDEPNFRLPREQASFGAGSPGSPPGSGVVLIILWERSVEGCTLEKVWKPVLLRVHIGALGVVVPLEREKKPVPLPSAQSRPCGRLPSAPVPP